MQTPVSSSRRLSTLECVTASALDVLLDDDQSLDPVTAEGLSNHLSMGLVALSRLGADDERLRQFAAAWRPRLVPRRSPRDSIGSGAWRTCLGTGRRYGDLVTYFTSTIAQDGVSTTLSDVLGTLLDGLGGAAFHGIIRLAYALEHGRPNDIACGLAYLADVYEPVNDPTLSRPRVQGNSSVFEVLTALAEDPNVAGRRRSSGSFALQMRTVLADTSFRQVVDRLAIDESTLAQTAAAALSLYRASGDFFALHTVTGSHAARIASDQLADPEQRIRAAGSLARSVAAAYVAIGTPPVMLPALRESSSQQIPDWTEIASAAIASDDVHVIKMVYSCRAEQAVWGDPSYQSTAAAVVGLPSTE